MLRTPVTLLVLSTACLAQRYRAAPPVVEFTIVVQDARGNPVTDLKREEITLTEDGDPRALAMLRFEGAMESGGHSLRRGMFSNRSGYSEGPSRNVVAVVTEGRADEVTRALAASAPDIRVELFPWTPAMTLAVMANRIAGIPGRRALVWNAPLETAGLRAAAERLATEGISVYGADGSLAGATGGRVVRSAALAAKEAAADLRAAYTVGFVAGEDSGTRWHTLAVKVERRGAQVLAPEGYASEEDSAEPEDWSDAQWTGVMTGALGSTALNLDAHCESADATVQVKLQVPNSQLYFRRVEGGLRAEVDLALVERTAAGEYRLQKTRASARYAEERAGEILAEATQFASKWKIGADAGTVRLIVRDRVTGRYGTLDVALNDVPAVGTVPAADPSSPATATAPPVAPDSDPFIARARAAALEFLHSLPNYVVRQNTNREVQTRQVWTVKDRISAEVVYEAGKETTRGVTLNGKPASDQQIANTGAWSTGQFGMMLRGIFAPESRAVFRERHGAARIGGRETLVYDYSVDRKYSAWELQAGGSTYISGFEGSIWVDRETARTLRYVARARSIPTEFPLDQAESSTDYRTVKIGEEEYLLPTSSVALVCSRQENGSGLRRLPTSSHYCARNVIEFRDYKQFGAQSNIDFGK